MNCTISAGAVGAPPACGGTSARAKNIEAERQDLVGLTQALVLRLQRLEFLYLAAAETRLGAGIDLGLVGPTLQAGPGDGETLADDHARRTQGGSRLGERGPFELLSL
jgi:hypothetical protein